MIGEVTDKSDRIKNIPDIVAASDQRIPGNRDSNGFYR